MAQRRAMALFETARAPVLECEFVDDTATVRRTNDAFDLTFGVDEATQGRAIADLFDGFDAPDLTECDPCDDTVVTDVERPTANGVGDFSLRIEPLGSVDDGGHRQLALYRPETTSQEYDNKLAALHEATRALIQQETKADVARSAVDAAVGVLGFRASSVHLLDAEREVLAPTVTTELIEDLLGGLPDLPAGESLAWEVYETGETAVYEGVGDHPEAYNSDTPLKSELIVPLGDHGVFLAGSTTQDAFSDADVSLATILASNTEAALDRIEREEALAERERELERKNERLEAFAGMVSHDLRNPLNVAQGCLELARADGDESRLDDVVEAHERMETLIEDLLELARQGEDIGDVAPVSVETVADEAWSLVHTGEATLEVTSGIGTIPADRSRLAEALENLFRNAIEHGGEDVTVRVEPTEEGFFVADDGPGIPTAERDRVFEVGYTGASGGTGIGLAIVADVATAHGWELSLNESADGGARFEFSVEAADT